MARMSKDQYLTKVHSEALAEFDNIQSALRDERLQCLKDRRFATIAGAQWEGPLWDQYENKPKFEVNKIHLAVIRIINEYRNNRIDVDFIPKSGEDDDELAEKCDMLLRADEQDSTADEAYDNAFEEAALGGIGAWRLRTQYEDETDEENSYQRIRFEPIYDADSSVYFDLNSKRQDKSDATRCFVIYSMTRQSYIDEWNDDPTSWPKEVHQYEFDWDTPDIVFIAEYYRIEEKKDTVFTFQHLDGTEEKVKKSEIEADESILERLTAVGATEVSQRKISRRRCRKYILSGGKILEDCGYIAGPNIPIVITYGKRWFIDNVERCMGHVRLATDVQRLKNMQLSKLGEISALSSIEKPILTPEQIAGHQLMWSEDNLRDYPYLLINPITGPDGSQTVGGPVAYTKSPQIPPAMAALLQITEQDMADLLGNQQNAEKMVSNISEKTVEMIQTRVDGQAYIYMSNFAKAQKRSGEIWLGMASELYCDEGRTMKGITQDGMPKPVKMMTPVVDAQTGEIDYENDMSEAKFDIVATVGPASASKREAIVKKLTAMMAVTQDPETLKVLQAMAMMNMEGEGMQDMRQYFRQILVKMGVIKPTEEEQAQMSMQQNQPDPNAVFLAAAAEEAQAKAAKARAEVVETVASAALKQAQTTKTYADADQTAQNMTLDTVEAVQQAAQGALIQPVVR